MCDAQIQTLCMRFSIQSSYEFLILCRAHSVFMKCRFKFRERSIFVQLELLSSGNEAREEVEMEVVSSETRYLYSGVVVVAGNLIYGLALKKRN